MTFNKILSLSAHNWKVMLKALFCQVVILALILALGFLVFGGVLDELVKVVQAGGWGDFISETVISISDGTFSGTAFSGSLAYCIEQTRAAIESIPNMWDRVEWSYISVIVLFLVYRMLVSFSDVPVSFQLYEYMTSNTARPFTWYFVKKFGESCRFVLLQTVISVLLDLLIVAGGVTICLVFVTMLKWWTIIPGILITVFLYSMRQAYCAFWLPSIATENMGIRQSLINGLTVIPKRFWRVFWKTFLIIVVMAAITVVSVVFLDDYVAKLILATVPNLCLFFLLKCVNMAEYFEATERPYFFKTVYVEGTDRYNRRKQRMERKNRGKN